MEWIVVSICYKKLLVKAYKKPTEKKTDKKKCLAMLEKHNRN